MPPQIQNVKVTIVGDGSCGKTCLCSVFATGTFEQMFIPTIYSDYVCDATSDGVPIRMSLQDTAGQEEYDRLRPLAYQSASVILICFAVNSSDSFENIEEKWIMEATHFAQSVPVILVGCKADLRGNQREIEDQRRLGQRFVSHDEAVTVAQKIGAKGYQECSAKANTGVDELFESAAREALRSSNTQKKKSITRRLITKCVVL